jgi:hypothetical protein
MLEIACVRGTVVVDVAEEGGERGPHPCTGLANRAHLRPMALGGRGGAPHSDPFDSLIPFAEGPGPPPMCSLV